MLAFVVMVPLFLASTAAWAACDEPTRSSDLSVHALNVDLAWMQLDRPKLEEHATQLEVVLPCLEEPLATSEVASYFRAHAMRGFLNRDTDGATAALRALKDLQPEYVFPATLVQADHPLRALLEELPARSDGPTILLAAPAGGWLQIDGIQSTEAPSDRPYTLQHIASNGAVWVTQRVDVGEIPVYRTATEQDSQRTTKRRKTRLIAGGIAAGAAASLWTTAVVGRVAYDQGQGQSTALFVLTDTAWVGSVASGASAVGLIGWGLATR